MAFLSTSGAEHRNAFALEAAAEQAGCALACSYSSAAEYDAALIAARRAAGIYGPRRRHWQMLVGAAAVAAALAVLSVFILIA